METGIQIELNNKVEKFIALLLFACTDWIHSAAQKRKARTWLKRSSTMFPPSCASAQTSRTCDEHTQEILKSTWIFLPKMFAHNFIHVVPYTDESW